MSKWVVDIGLEVHVQLKLRSKLFCGCAVAFGRAPNTNVCPVCVGMPGTLPVTNARALTLAAKLGLALGCNVAERSVFERKHYFYPDLPKSYQITQQDVPICTGGAVTARVDGEWRAFPLIRIHIEEDAGKLTHRPAHGVSLVDLNRAGTALVEVVSEPCLHTPAEASAYLKALREVVRLLGVSDGDMEKGHLRCDVNLSIRRSRDEPLGTRVEIKNVNSFRFVAKAIELEARRQAKVLASGGTLLQETRGYDEDVQRTFVMRSKEAAPEYRYFPDPDVPVAIIDAEMLEKVRAELPELPHARWRRYREVLGLTDEHAMAIQSVPGLPEWFDDAVQGDKELARTLAKLVMAEVLSALNRDKICIDEYPVLPRIAGEIARLLHDERISAKSAQRVLLEVGSQTESAVEIVDRLNLWLIDDPAVIGPIIDEALTESPLIPGQDRAGSKHVEEWLISQVMKRTRGAAAPRVVVALVAERLGRN